MLPLERRYRRLLLCYPRAYRRARAEEIVTTLLELAPPGRTRPTLREAANLLRQGLRARLGRPASRGVVLWAAITAIMCGLLGGATGTLLGWGGARPLPTVEDARAVFNDILPGHQVDEVQTPGEFATHGHRPGWRELLWLQFDDYWMLGVIGIPAKESTSPTDNQQLLQTARERLIAAGWTVRPVMPLDHEGCARWGCDWSQPPNRHHLSAVKGDDILILQTDDAPGIDSNFSIVLERATPWTVYPAGIGFGLLGVAVGWMLFGWASRRTDGNRFGVQAPVVLSHALATLIWLLHVGIGTYKETTVFLRVPGSRSQPFWEWIGLPNFFQLGTLFALVALVFAASARPQTRWAEQDSAA